MFKDHLNQAVINQYYKLVVSELVILKHGAHV